VAFSAYTWLLERRSATLVATHTFVNPVIAVLLGWLAAGETLTPQVIGAAVLILVAVVLLKSESPARPTVRLASTDVEPGQAPRVAGRTEDRAPLPVRGAT
jgi:hypothetical protein